MPLAVDLPDWNPVEVPQAEPAKAKAEWSNRIGVPGAIRLGMARHRRLGALAFAVLIPVGAVRLVAESVQPAGTLGLWGVVDPILILAAVVGAIGVAVCLQGARRQRTNAVHAAQVLLKQANQNVTDFDLRPLLGSIKRFDAWAAQRKLVPLASSEAGERASDEGARLMFAEANRGDHALRLERFGKPLAASFRAAAVARLIGAILLYGALVSLGIGGIITLMLLNTAHPDAITTYGVFVVAMVVVFVLGWIVLAAARRRNLAIAGELWETLRVKDDHLTRSGSAALLARPYLYDLWLGKYGPAL